MEARATRAATSTTRRTHAAASRATTGWRTSSLPTSDETAARGPSGSPARAFIGLGSNLGDRETTLGAALGRLAAQDGIDVVAVSTFRETDPVGNVDQPRFINAAAELRTILGPVQLLERLLEVERGLGRDRSREGRWGPRTLDLDLLLYGDETIEEPGLTVPHPRLAERAFVLEPLLELDPGLSLPDGRRLRDL
jgi:2-amino-4-hydroxy-6-hydroxymethyldihydropteridine diphosphokinase